MKSYKNNTTTYHNRQLLQAPPALQVALLLEMACKNLSQAIVMQEKKQPAERYNLCMKTVQIITGMASCLDKSTPETEKMSEVLNTYYASVLNGIAEFNITQDVEIAKNIKKSLQEMSSCWREVAQNVHNAPPSEEESSSLTQAAASFSQTV